MRSFPALLLAVGVAFGAIPACSPSPFDFDPPTSRPLLRELPRYSAPANPDQKRQPADVVSTSGDLTLRNALAAALVRNPDLRAAAWEPRLAEARRLQAGLLPNPEVGLEFENFAGSGGLSGTDALETTLVLSQLIELGGKRDRRIDVADRAWAVSTLDYEAARLDVLTETAARFIHVLELQQRVELAERTRALAEESRRVVERRVEAGDVSPIDEIKARLTSESARIAVERLERELEAARRELSAMWDEIDPDFVTVVGSLDEMIDVPALDVLTAQVESHPEVQRWLAETERRMAAVELERAQAVPDVTAGLGVRHVNEMDDVGLVGGVSMPLPLFDRNQGGILAARLRVAQALDEGRASRRALATQLVRAHSRLTAAFHEARSIDSVLLPAARDAYEATRRAYDEGKLPYLDVLDAQRTLFDIEAQLLEALVEYHRELVQVEGLVSAPLNTRGAGVLDASEQSGESP